MKDKCGVAGVWFDKEKNRDSAAIYIYYALQALQHRGQESAGIAVTGGGSVIADKGMGLVTDYFNRERLQRLVGYAGIGHVRYSTTGSSKLENCQPFTVQYKGGTIALAHNGNLVNYRELKKDLEADGRIFTSDSDTEVIAHLLVKELMRNDLENAVRETMRLLVGSYSLVILIEDKIVGVRDPLGFKPLCIGRVENGYVLASESCAIDTLNGELVRDVAPGEMVVLGDRIESYKLFHSRSRAHCMFEFVYFARPDSIMDGRLIYKVRHRIGEELAKECPTAADIVSPVPDSGITSAIGYSKASGTQYAEGMIKNRYIGRTFIMPGQDLRETAIRLKLNTVKENVCGKRRHSHRRQHRARDDVPAHHRPDPQGRRQQSPRAHRQPADHLTLLPGHRHGHARGTHRRPQIGQRRRVPDRCRFSLLHLPGRPDQVHRHPARRPVLRLSDRRLSRRDTGRAMRSPADQAQQLRCGVKAVLRPDAFLNISPDRHDFLPSFYLMNFNILIKR